MSINFIQEDCSKVEYYTNLTAVSNWLEINLSDYDWHFADVDGDWFDLNDPEPKWLTGEELDLKLKDNNIQFIWAVISAYPKGAPPKLDNQVYADGNPIFWTGSPKKQLKDSLFEIVCWDSSATLFIGLPLNLGQNLIKNAPGIKDLDLENQKRIPFNF